MLDDVTSQSGGPSQSGVLYVINMDFEMVNATVNFLKVLIRMLKSYKGQLDTIVNNENNSRNSLQHFFFSLINLSTTPHLIANLQYKQTDTTTKGETKV